MTEEVQNGIEKFVRKLVGDNAAWWADWWTEDYSWEGLAAKPWLGWSVSKSGELAKRDLTGEPGIPQLGHLPDGSRDATLQDYWRDQERFLIREPNSDRQWTFFHCPLVFGDGSINPLLSSTDGVEKSEELAPYVASIMDKIEASFETAPDALRQYRSYRNALESDRKTEWIVPIDGRVQLQGTTTVGFLNHTTSPKHICAYKSFMFNVVQHTESIGPVADFSYSLPFFSDFSSKTFEGPANFSHSKLYGYIFECKFKGAADFSHAVIEHPYFTKCRFSGLANFSGAVFLNRATFSECCFEQEARYSDAKFLGAANFGNCAFIGAVCLDDAIFYREADFSGVADGNPIIQPDQVVSLVNFSDEEKKKIEGTIKSSTVSSPLNYQSFPSISAERATFHYSANFSNRDILSPSSFEGAVFEHLVAFHGSRLHPGTNFSHTRFDKAFRFKIENLLCIPDDLLMIKYTSENFFGFEEQATFKEWKAEFNREIIDRHDDMDAEYFSSLEACFRTLKQGMESIRDGSKEGEFFRMELLAKRRVKGLPAWEVVASHGYELFSDYGNSIARPLIFLFLIFLPSFALVFFAIGENLGVNGSGGLGHVVLWEHRLPIADRQFSNLMDALSFSWSNIFHPLSALSAENYDNSEKTWLSQLLHKNGSTNALGIKMLATGESIGAVILAFLFGLAIRRRFQIN